MSIQPKTARGLLTKNRIIKAAEQVIGKKGYYNASINDIARRAKVAPGTIYIYFEDKYSLYCFLLQQYGHHIRKEIARATQGMTDRLQIEREGLLAFLKIVRKMPYMYKIIWESLYINQKLFVNYYEEFARRYVLQLDAIDDQLIDADHEVLAYALMGISNFVGLKYVFFDQDADLEYVADEVTKMLRLGLLKTMR